jgi:uncharacterized protein (TIGR04255 family)
MEYEVFRNSPIIEAGLYFAYPTLDDLELSAKLLHQAISSEYPEFHPRADIEVGGKEPDYVRLLSDDGLNVITISRRQFSYHRLRPYTNWGDFEKRGRKAWGAFCNYFGPEVITEVSLRYINRIEMPPVQDWDEYLLMGPKIPALIDTGVDDFLMVLHLSDASVPAVAVVTQKSDTRAATSVIALLLDIEARSLQEFQCPPERDALWEMVQRLRDYKNRLFFEGLTESAKEIFR